MHPHDYRRHADALLLHGNHANSPTGILYVYRMPALLSTCTQEKKARASLFALVLLNMFPPETGLFEQENDGSHRECVCMYADFF